HRPSGRGEMSARHILGDYDSWLTTESSDRPEPNDDETDLDDDRERGCDSLPPLQLGQRRSWNTGGAA
ncbi:MAG: hypothetical protein ACLQUT_02405, partial [Thermoleophilia bacterium]